jgi:hypothetical protein
MKFLKGLALSLLGLLLFLSLAAFGMVLTINQTVLNPGFVASQVNRLDLSSLAEDFINEQISQQIPLEEEFIAGALEDTITELEPWIKEQANTVIYAGYDYLLGRSQSLSVVISTEELKEGLKDNLKSAILQSPPPQLAGIPPEMIEAYFDQYYQQYSQQIPSTIDISEGMISPEVMSTLEQVREYISYIQIAYKALIGFMLLLIGLIILIHRQVRGTTRQLGITFLVYGIPAFISVFVIKNYALERMSQLIGQPGLPASLQAWLPQLVNDILAPLQMFSLGILIGGVVLLIVSFVYKREPSY